MQDAWEDWLRPVVIIVLLVGLVVAWWLRWLSDETIGWTVLAAGSVAVAGFVGPRAWRQARSPLAGWLSLAVLAGAIGLCAWVPLQLVLPELHLETSLASGPATAEIPAGDGDRWIVYLRASPKSSTKEAKDVRLSLSGQGVKPQSLFTSVEPASTSKSGPPSAGWSAVWRVTANFRAGASLTVSQLGEQTLEWPVTLAVARGTPPMLPFLVLGGVLALAGLVLEARGRTTLRTGLGIVGVGSLVMSAAFAHWYTAGELAKAVAGTLFLAALAAGVVSALLLSPLRKRISPATASGPVSEHAETRR